METVYRASSQAGTTERKEMSDGYIMQAEAGVASKLSLSFSVSSKLITIG
jgi:hypothetical protein